MIRTKNLTNPTSETENIQLVEVTQDQRVLPEVTEEGNQTSVLNQHYEEPSSALCMLLLNHVLAGYDIGKFSPLNKNIKSMLLH